MLLTSLKSRYSVLNPTTFGIQNLCQGRIRLPSEFATKLLAKTLPLPLFNFIIFIPLPFVKAVVTMSDNEDNDMPRNRFPAIRTVSLRQRSNVTDSSVEVSSGGVSRNPSMNTDSQNSGRWNVDAILEKRVVLDENGVEQIEYLVKWTPDGTQTWPNSWQPEDDVDDGPLLQRFERSGEAAYDEEVQEVDEEFAVAEAHNPNAFDNVVAEIQGIGVEQAGNPYWQKLKLGYWSILRLMYPAVRAHGAADDFPDFGAFQWNGLEILAATHAKVLQAVCGRKGLTRSKYTDRGLLRLLRSNLAQSKKHPCIYVLELVDDRGRSLTVDETRHLISGVRKYMKDDPNDSDVEWAI